MSSVDRASNDDDDVRRMHARKSRSTRYEKRDSCFYTPLDRSNSMMATTSIFLSFNQENVRSTLHKIHSDNAAMGWGAVGGEGGGLSTSNEYVTISSAHDVNLITMHQTKKQTCRA